MPSVENFSFTKDIILQGTQLKKLVPQSFFTEQDTFFKAVIEYILL